MFPHVTDYLARRVTDSLRATTISASNVVTSVSNIAVTGATAIAFDRAGFNLTLTVIAAFLTAVSVAIYLAWRATGDLGRPVIDASPPSDVPWP